MRFFTVALLLAVSVTAHADVVGSGRVVQITRNVGEFSAIAVEAGIQAKVEAGDPGALTLRGEDNILPHVKTEIRGGTLVIGFENHTDIQTHEPVTVALRAPRLDGLSASGGAQIDASTPAGKSLKMSASGGGRIHLAAQVKVHRLDLDASGAGDLTIDAVDAGEAHFTASGGSAMTLTGSAKTLDLELSGAGRLEGKGFTVSALKVNGSGGATARLKVTGPVQGSLSGGCSIHVGADAQIDVATSGGSEVRR